ncbi:erbin [Uranotaenia lowii]|uniref:erbin n=1 Tax=Uranotaenia lowii TaxID=190385 RepID=UPI00247A74D6|nr:erbin [Uranotaenia lowii]
MVDIQAPLFKILSKTEDKIRFHYVHYLVDQCAHTEGRKLNLARFKLRSVPATLVSCCPFLTKLSLDGNCLTSESIIVLRSLKFLRHLALNDNELSHFPEELCRLKFVEFLNISGNPVAELPEAVGKLKNLITLWCNDMLLERLPEAFGQLQRLKTFGARNNRLSELPVSFGQLRRLKWLTLENNLLSELPAESFRLLYRLAHLNLKGNHFHQLPDVLPELRRLQFCSFESNLIATIPEDFLDELNFVGTLILTGNPLDPSIFTNQENMKAPDLNFIFDIWNEELTEDWIHSLPNSELNSPNSSDGENNDPEDFEPYQLQLTEMARFSCGV